MHTYTSSFLQAVLGDEAAQSLRKSADRSQELSTVIGARAIVGWLSLASRRGFEGEVPGLAGSYLRLMKSEDHSFTGEIRVGKNDYSFQNSDLPTVAAALAVSLGADQAPSIDIKDTDLADLGKNIDILLKTQVLKEKTQVSDSEDAESSEDLEKAGGITTPGEQAKPKAPAGPVGGGFTSPKLKSPSRSKKALGTKLTMSQSAAKCSVCGESQMRGDRFTACFCLRDLAKSATVTNVDAKGYTIEFDPEVWNKEDVALLMEIVGEGNE